MRAPMQPKVGHACSGGMGVDTDAQRDQGLEQRTQEGPAVMACRGWAVPAEQRAGIQAEQTHSKRGEHYCFGHLIAP